MNKKNISITIDDIMVKNTPDGMSFTIDSAPALNRLANISDPIQAVKPVSKQSETTDDVSASDSVSKLNSILDKRKENTASLLADILAEALHPFKKEDDLYCYRHGVYVKCTKKKMLELIHDIIGERTGKVSMREQTQSVDLLIASTPQTDSIPHHPNLLNVKNGILDISKMTVMPHNPSYKFTYQLSLDYNPKAACPKFIKDMINISANKSGYYEHLQEYCGYLISDYPILKEFGLFIGPPNTSKSFVAAIIRMIIGNEYVNAVDMKKLNHEYYLASMCSKKLNICSDMGSAPLSDFGILKQLTSSDDAIQIRNIFSSTKSILDRPKLLFAANQYPNITASMENMKALFARSHIIPFDYKIKKKNRIDGYAQILFEEEGEGILNWMLEGYVRFLKNGRKFTKCFAVQQARDEFKRTYSLAVDFVDECLEFKKKGKVFTCELNEALQEYAEDHNVPYNPIYMKQLRGILFSMGIENKKIRKKKKTLQGFEGIEFRRFML